MGNLPEKKTIEFGTPNDSIRLIQFASNLWCLLAELWLSSFSCEARGFAVAVLILYNFVGFLYA